jgi:hypothetical protein
MKYITTLIKKILPKELTKELTKELPRPMGRWTIDYCNKKIDKKIDLSNEDHCGPCGQYAITKMNLQNKSIIPYKIKN